MDVELQSPPWYDKIIRSIYFQIAVGGILVVVMGFFFYRALYPAPANTCTLEAKICPDGSTVGRTGKNCEFAPCPTSSATQFTISTVRKSDGAESSGTMFEKSRHVLRTKAEFLSLLQTKFDDPCVKSNSCTIPELDGTNSMALAVFAGTKSSGGHSIEITKAVKEVKDGKDVLNVTVVTLSPGPACIVTTVITSPYHIITVPKFAGDVIFTEINETYPCQ